MTLFLPAPLMRGRTLSHSTIMGRMLWMVLAAVVVTSFCTTACHGAMAGVKAVPVSLAPSIRIAFYNGGGTFAALSLVGDGQTMLHHLVDAASVFWDDQVIAHAVLAQRVKVDGSVRHRSRLLKLQSMLFCLRLKSRDGTTRIQPPGCGTKDTRFIAFPHNSMSCSKASPNDVSCPSWA